jgi:DNA-binding transcriptional MerR regulator
MISLMKTVDVCRHLSVGYARLYSWPRRGLMPWPALRDSSGHLLWTAKDIERARAVRDALAARRRRAA